MSSDRPEVVAGSRPWPVRAAIAGALVTILVFYPGYMSNDSFTQLKQAQTGMTSDNHPVLLVFVWMASQWVAYGPFVMLLAQSALFWSGLYLLSGVVARQDTRLRLLTIAIGFFPPVAGLLGTIWKDIWLTGFLLWAAYFAARFVEERTWPTALGAAVSALMAVSMRHNGVAAIVPLTIAVAATALRPAIGGWRPILRNLSQIFVGTLLALALFGISTIFASAVADTKGYFWQVLADYDLAAISVRTDNLVVPSTRLKEGAGLDEVTNVYTERSLLPLYRPLCEENTSECQPVFRRSTSSIELHKLRSTWIREIAANPGIYLAHRWDVFSEVIGATDNPVWAPYYTQRYAQDLEIATPASPFNNAVGRIMARLSTTPIYWVWLYGLVLIAVAGLTVVRLSQKRSSRASFITMMVAMSGLLYLASYLPLAPSPDFRYSHWTILSSLVALASMKTWHEST
ncbi:MAG: hypothetical protein WED83_02245 [Acidimicrobiia bacterium]